MHIGSFEPTVMFFGMTNSPATLQVMMNEILRDLINEGKVVAFVDNVLVGTEIEEGYDEIVKEILRRLEENDLYVKPEKCVEGEENRVLRSGYRTQRNRDGDGEDGRHT